MDSLLGLLGMLFFMFLVLAAAVEVILEVLRGILEQFGLTWVKSKVSLDEALRLSSELIFARMSWAFLFGCSSHSLNMCEMPAAGPQGFSPRPTPRLGLSI